MCNLEVKGYSVPVEYSSLDALYAVSYWRFQINFVVIIKTGLCLLNGLFSDFPLPQLKKLSSHQVS